MYKYQEQFERVKRYLAKIENQNRPDMEYDDDLWAFFQNVFHLKDWVKNDSQVDNTKFDIETIWQQFYSLKVCADLCNRTKHLKLDRKRVDARVKGKRITMILYDRVNIGSNEKPEEADPPMEISYNHTLVDSTGKETSALEIAREAVNDWEQIILNYVSKFHKS